MRKTIPIISLLAGAALLGGISMPTWAVDGVILIDQNKAMAGNVTPGDTPGFPVTISLPGSYRLAGNLTVPDANTTAIQITANSVTLDLNGFAIIGPNVCVGHPIHCTQSGNGDGIISASGSGITVRNGSVGGMGRFGIRLDGGDGELVEKMLISNNGVTGISIVSGTASNNVVITNGGAGIDFSDGVASYNHVQDNGNEGISASGGAAIINNSAVGNGSCGLNLSGATGYAGNVMLSNTSAPTPANQVCGGRQIGSNLCHTALCP